MEPKILSTGFWCGCMVNPFAVAQSWLAVWRSYPLWGFPLDPVPLTHQPRVHQPVAQNIKKPVTISLFLLPWYNRKVNWLIEVSELSKRRMNGVHGSWGINTKERKKKAEDKLTVEERSWKNWKWKCEQVWIFVKERSVHVMLLENWLKEQSSKNV